MGDNIKFNNQGGKITGNVNAGRGRQSIKGDVTDTQITKSNDKEEQFLKAIQELREEIKKLKVPEKDSKELEKAISTIETEVKKEEPDEDIIKAKFEKANTVVESMSKVADSSSEAVEKTGKLLEKIQKVGTTIAVYSPTLVDTVKAIWPG